jgi:flagellar hook-associated protein 2
MTEVSSTSATGSTIGSSVLTALDIGSGLDSSKLAFDLSNAEKVPKEASLNRQITESETSVSGYALLSYQVDLLKANFEALNDADELATATGSSTNSSAVSFSSLSGTAVSGDYDLTVTQLAESQRTISDQFASTTSVLNGGTAFTLSLATGATEQGTYNQALTQASLRTALASGSITLSDGVNSFSVSQAQVNSAGGTSSGGETLAGYVAAIEANKDANFLFGFAVNGTDGVTFTQTTAGTGTLASTTGTVTAGVTAATPITGVAAIYSSAVSASVTGALVVSDGSTTVTVASAAYTSVADQVAAIQAGSGYDDLAFTVAASNNNIEFTYKTTGAIATAPTLSIAGSSQTVANSTLGVTAVNSPVVTTVAISTTTPEGVVAAINEANTGVSAVLIDTGNDGTNYRIVLTGDTGSDSIFAVTSSVSDDLGFGTADNTLQAAQDAIVDFEGLTISRSSNAISDIISGATVSLSAVTTSSVRLAIVADTGTLKANVENIVTVYNALNDLYSSLGVVDPDSDSEVNGALAQDSALIRQLKSTIRTSLFADSSSGSGDITALRDLGISINKTGDLTFDETAYDSVIASSYSDVVKMLTANTSNQNLFDTADKGLAQDIVTVLDGLTNTNGVITARSTNATAAVTDYQEELATLETRIEALYQRYLGQFSVMEGMMAKMNSTKDYLTGQLENLSKAYDK